MIFLKVCDLMSKIAVLIPCYNESQTIAKVISDYRTALPEADLYVYDNNSTDGTDEIARNCGDRVIVCYEYRQGKGNVIRSMFRDIDADCYLIIDGDDTYPAESAREMCELVLQKKADMVIGDRLFSTYFEENKRPFHNFGNVIVRYFINLLWHPKDYISDVMTGYRAFSPTFVKSFPTISKGFEIETEMTIHALDKNLLIRSVPVQYRDRPVGSESKLNTYVDGARVLLTIFNFYRDYKPLQFFGILAVILALISIFLFMPIFYHYLQTGSVPKIPTLIVSSFTMVAAVLSLFCGLILDTVAKNNRKTFEIHLNIIKMLSEKRKR